MTLHCMVANCLAFNDSQLNTSKSEVLRAGAATQLKKMEGDSVIVAGASLTCIYQEAGQQDGGVSVLFC